MNLIWQRYGYVYKSVWIETWSRLASFAVATRTLKICTASSTKTSEVIFFAFY